MKLIRKDQAIHVDKTNGTKVDYYLLNDAEIHYNKINPRTLQEWAYQGKSSTERLCQRI